MSMRPITLTVFILLASAPPCFAQKGGDRPKTPPSTIEEQEREIIERGDAITGGRPAASVLLDAPQPLKLPKGEGAWVVQVVTRGGVAGVGKGDRTINSLGEVICNPSGAACKSDLPQGALQTLAGAVASAKTKSWEGASAGVCRDCYVTVMMLQRREAGRGGRTYLFSWDDLSAGKVPADVLRVYDTALALTSGQR